MDEQLGFSAWESWVPRVYLTMLLMQFQGRDGKKWRASAGDAWGALSAAEAGRLCDKALAVLRRCLASAVQARSRILLLVSA